MVLVDFTLGERWRVFGELSLAPVRKAAEPMRAAPPAQIVVTQQSSGAGRIDPQETSARRNAEAALMQRML